jgi:hypothetical protein
MGFFGDLNKLRVMGEEQQANMDVKGRMANAQANIDKMNKAYAMASPQNADPASEARRVDATATISSARQSGILVNMSMSVDVELLVMLPSGIPLPVSTSLLVPGIQLSRLLPGNQVAVSIDPQIPESVRIEWNR